MHACVVYIYILVNSEQCYNIGRCWLMCVCVTCGILISLTISGGVTFHSYGRLLPTNFLVTEPEQIEGPDGVGRVNCTTTRTFADFQNDSLTSVTEDNNEDLHQIHMGASATLIVKSTRRQNFSNTLVYCNGHSLYLHLSAQSEGQDTHTHTHTHRHTQTHTHTHRPTQTHTHTHTHTLHFEFKELASSVYIFAFGAQFYASCQV